MGRTREGEKTGVVAGFILALIILLYPCHAYPRTLEPFRASPDQVLVIYNADWEEDSEGSEPGQDSEEVARYYAAMHTDPVTGKKPYLLGLSCRHPFSGEHLNHWFIREVSEDNKNGVVFTGKGPAPDGGWIRDSRKVEITVDEPDVDWDSVRITCRSELSGRERVLRPTEYRVSSNGRAKTFSFNAAAFFSGTVTVEFRIKDTSGRTIRDLSLKFYDIKDFVFSPVGPDNIPDDMILEEDVLTPVREFLEDPANALPDGTLLKDHILYIVLVHGMPYSAKAVFGIEHGATSRPGDHGYLASLEQRLQTLYYAWDSPAFRPPVVSMYMSGGPDSDKGVRNHIITTAMRRPQQGVRWNPYLHPDTHSFLSRKPKPPRFVNKTPLGRLRRIFPEDYFIYAVSRVDGVDAEEAKRIIDYSLYATKHLRPEMDCRVRRALAAEGKADIGDLRKRLKQAEDENAWGGEELVRLGFITPAGGERQGLPFLARPSGEADGECEEGAADWKESGFYPGGIGRRVKSHNGWNIRGAPVWEYLRRGVTVTACGAPAYGGGPHITNATFWDNRILIRYLFRGRDLGEALLISTFYTNWSTSLIGDPLMHPDLHETAIDKAPPELQGEVSVRLDGEAGVVTAHIRAELLHRPRTPEVAVLKVVFYDAEGGEISASSPLYSSRPAVTVKGLRHDTEYTMKAVLTDPYGNRTEVPARTIRTGPERVTAPLMRLFRKLK